MLLARNIDIFILILLLLLLNNSQASTVLSVDVDYLLKKSELIFEGEVLSSQSRWNKDKTSISTYIEFHIKDIIKGSHTSDTLTLHFAGGTVGSTRLNIASMNYPKVGEQGIYFTHKSSINYINPFIGWSQGHFIVKQDSDRTERVMTYDGLPVIDIEEPNVANETTLKDLHHSHESHSEYVPFSHGIVRGLHVGENKNQMHEAMSVTVFKNSLVNKLRAIQSSSNDN